jgi:hypothetical protein
MAQEFLRAPARDRAHEHRAQRRDEVLAAELVPEERAAGPAEHRAVVPAVAGGRPAEIVASVAVAVAAAAVPAQVSVGAPGAGLVFVPGGVF